jgi:hypothetical protein
MLAKKKLQEQRIEWREGNKVVVAKKPIISNS